MAVLPSSSLRKKFDMAGPGPFLRTDRKPPFLSGCLAPAWTPILGPAAMALSTDWRASCELPEDFLETVVGGRRGFDWLALDGALVGREALRLGIVVMLGNWQGGAAAIAGAL